MCKQTFTGALRTLSASVYTAAISVSLIQTYKEKQIKKLWVPPRYIYLFLTRMMAPAVSCSLRPPGARAAA